MVRTIPVMTQPGQIWLSCFFEPCLQESHTPSLQEPHIASLQESRITSLQELHIASLTHLLTFKFLVQSQALGHISDDNYVIRSVSCYVCSSSILEIWWEYKNMMPIDVISNISHMIVLSCSFSNYQSCAASLM